MVRAVYHLDRSPRPDGIARNRKVTTHSHKNEFFTTASIMVFYSFPK